MLKLNLRTLCSTQRILFVIWKQKMFLRLKACEGNERTYISIDMLAEGWQKDLNCATFEFPSFRSYSQQCRENYFRTEAARSVCSEERRFR
jgi:hypothetical protein